MDNNAQGKTPIELFANILELLVALTSAIHQLQQATAVQQQPHRNEQPPPSNENHQTIENGLASNDSSGRRINRKRKSIREPEHEPVSEPKTKQNRRHSMYSKANSQGQDTVIVKPKRPTTIENARVKKNRSLDLRNSIARDKAIDVHVANDISIQPNTNRDTYASNTLYQTLCLYCNTSQKFLVSHYMKQHPEYEVPIARLSPVMAERLRSQAEKFQLKMGKIDAFCLFCEENKTMPKHQWTRHILSHTGSQNMFSCDTCNMQFKQKIDHENCAGEVINVFEKNSSDSSLVGYICKDCNYIQIHLSAIHKHLTNEHKHASISESMYQKLTLIPDMTQLHSPTSEKYCFVKALKRFKCTICKNQLENAQQFTAHFNEQHNDVDQYRCFCGEIVRKNGQKWHGAEWVASHLLKHRTDLYECMICNGVIIKKSDIENQTTNTMHHNTILKHMFEKHRDSEIKYQHVCRSLNRHTTITETTIVKMKCNLCGYQMDGTLTTALEHFNNDHPSKNFSTTGIVTKKISILPQNSIEPKTTYEGGIQLLNCNIQVS